METATSDMEKNEYIAGYKNLNAYQKANELTLLIYKLTRKFPKEELFCLVSQMRRCAVSVPANIVEGYGRRTNKDKQQFYHIARGSLNELEYYIDLSRQLGYFESADYEQAVSLRQDAGKLLTGLIKSLVAA
jgi:four helix bundle protein